MAKGIISAPDIARRAAELVGGDREVTHGAKLANFTCVAQLWTSWLAARDPLHIVPVDLTAADVGAMMVLFKLARTLNGDFNMDDYIDACGYAACMGEVTDAVRR